MAVTARDVAWVAGLLEGEGCFHTNKWKHYFIKLSMTDRDIVERFALLTGGSLFQHVTDKRGNRKQQWSSRVHGFKAAQWMMSIYPLMGIRRREKIRELLALWRKTQAQLPRGTHIPCRGCGTITVSDRNRGHYCPGCFRERQRSSLRASRCRMRTSDPVRHQRYKDYMREWRAARSGQSALPGFK